MSFLHFPNGGEVCGRYVIEPTGSSHRARYIVRDAETGYTVNGGADYPTPDDAREALAAELSRQVEEVLREGWML